MGLSCNNICSHSFRQSENQTTSYFFFQEVDKALRKPRNPKNMYEVIVLKEGYSIKEGPGMYMSPVYSRYAKTTLLPTFYPILSCKILVISIRHLQAMWKTLCTLDIHVHCIQNKSISRLSLVKNNSNTPHL